MSRESLRQSGIKLLPGRLKGENVISAYFNGPREPPVSPRQYENSVATYYAEHLRYLVPLGAAKNPSYNVRAATPPSLPDHAPLAASGLADAELLVQQLINALAVVCSLFVRAAAQGRSPDAHDRQRRNRFPLAARREPPERHTCGRLQLVAAVSPVPLYSCSPRSRSFRDGGYAPQVRARGQD